MNNYLVLPDGRMDTKSAAMYLGFSEQTLRNWKVKGHGPKYLKAGGKVFYFQRELDRWLTGQIDYVN